MFSGALFAGTLFRGRLFGRQEDQAAVLYGGKNLYDLLEEARRLRGRRVVVQAEQAALQVKEAVKAKKQPAEIRASQIAREGQPRSEMKAAELREIARKLAALEIAIQQAEQDEMAIIFAMVAEAC